MGRVLLVGSHVSDFLRAIALNFSVKGFTISLLLSSGEGSELLKNECLDKGCESFKTYLDQTHVDEPQLLGSIIFSLTFDDDAAAMIQKNVITAINMVKFFKPKVIECSFVFLGLVIYEMPSIPTTSGASSCTAAIKSLVESWASENASSKLRFSLLTLGPVDFQDFVAFFAKRCFFVDSMVNRLDVFGALTFLTEWRGEGNIIELVLKPQESFVPEIRHVWRDSTDRACKRFSVKASDRKCSNSAPVALILGASKGIGLEITLALARRNFSLALVARDMTHLEKAKNQALCSGSPRVECYAFDVSETSLLKRFFGSVLTIFGGISTLVCNVGLNRRINVLGSSLDEMDRILDMNLKATMHSALMASRMMLFNSLVDTQDKIFTPSIVIVGSLVSSYKYSAWPGMSNYFTAKWGQHGFANALREDLAPLGIYTTILLLGHVNNDSGTRGLEFLQKDGLISTTDVASLVCFAIDCPTPPAAIMVKPRKELCPSHEKLISNSYSKM